MKKNRKYKKGVDQNKEDKDRERYIYKSKSPAQALQSI